MRHFDHVGPADRRRLFAVPPQDFTAGSEAGILAAALGATLYMPADRRALADDLDRVAARGVVSVAICLEDAIADDEVAAAQHNLVTQLREVARRWHGTAGQLLFVRVRAPEQITAIVRDLGPAASVLCGFVLPKLTDLNGHGFLDAMQDAGESAGVRLLAMPVLESPEIMYRESRIGSLTAIQAMLGKRRRSILAVRIGATDLSALFGLRRGRELTVYDIRVVAEAIADIVNVLGRADGSGHIVTGPVWEYFRPGGPDAGLLREVALDKANGLTGKTVIHPSHAAAVHAQLVVTAEEYADASDIAEAGAGGVRASSYRNKMNEIKPHRAWAQRTLQRAAAFGVAAEGVTPGDLLTAGRPE